MEPFPGFSDGRPGLEPPRFRLRTLMWITAGLCLVFATFSWAGPFATLLALFLFAVVFAHVAGTWLGTQLRRNGSTPHDRPALAVPLRRERPRREHFAPRSRLHGRESLGWLPVVITSLGVLTGAAVGTSLLVLADSGPVATTNLVIGALAFGVIGGLTSFALACFVQVSLTAFWEARRHAEGDRLRPENAGHGGPTA